LYIVLLKGFEYGLVVHQRSICQIKGGDGFYVGIPNATQPKTKKANKKKVYNNEIIYDNND
jgi:hypothetical protein